MAIFQYRGVGSDGAERSGELEAASRQEALKKLFSERIQPSSLLTGGSSGPTNFTVEPFSGSAGGAGANAAAKKILLRPPEIIDFSEELVEFLESGLQLEAVLQIMEAQEESSAKSRLANVLREKVREGTDFSTALRLASPSFGELYCRVVEAGEQSGALTTLLRRHVGYLKASEDLRQRVHLALIYPAFLIAAAALTIIVFLTYLVPQLSTLLANTGGTLPLPTLLLLRLGRGLQEYSVPLLLFGGTGLVFGYLQLQRPEGRRWWDEYQLQLPVWGPLLRESFQAQFCQTLANLLQNGLALHEALALLAGSLGNTYHRELVQQLIIQLREGLSLTRAMKSVGYFSSALRDLIQVGEQTGELGVCLEKVGQRFERLIGQKIERLMALVQPVIVVCLGIMVFLIAWSMMSGIFQAMHGLQRHR